MRRREEKEKKPKLLHRGEPSDRGVIEDVETGMKHHKEHGTGSHLAHYESGQKQQHAPNKIDRVIRGPIMREQAHRNPLSKISKDTFRGDGVTLSDRNRDRP
jgi:hypothetical protein